MNVLSYPPIIDSLSLLELKKQVRQFHPLGVNQWIGRYDEPENTIEKYIQDSFDFYLAPQYPTAVGFEWWIESLDGHNTITLHSNHDDTYRIQNNGKMKYPLASIETHLTNDIDPTTILDTKHGNHWEEYTNLPPTESTFSVPEEGKFVISDPRYVRGVFGRCSTRLSLCYDVWHYKLQHLHRVGIVTKPFNCRFYKREATLPTQWLGKTRILKVNLSNKTITNKFPVKFTEGETWKVTQ